MNGRKHLKISHCLEKGSSVPPKAFMFMEKRNGTQRFEVKADASVSMPFDEAVSLLVVHCLMRKQMPNDFRVMAPAGENLQDGLRQRARKLMLACSLIQASIQLTGRQQEVPRGVQQALSNKAIGMKLNLSERAVKFHVSALLVKLEATGRMGRMREAAGLLSAVKVPTGVDTPQLGAGKEHGVGQELRISRELLIQMNALERRFRG